MRRPAPPRRQPKTQRLTEDRIAAAARLRQAEAATADAAARMDELATRRREAQASLAARAETMQPLLPLIERLSLFPAETLLAVPARAEDTLRGVLVLRGLAGQLGQEAVALRREQARLAAATGALEAEAPRLAAALSAQQSEAAALDRQIAAAETGRRQAEGEAAAAAQRAASEAARAETLRGVLAELDAQRRSEQARARRRHAERDSVRHEPRAADRRRHDRQLGATPWPAHRAGGGHHRPRLGRRDGGWAGDRHFVSGAAGGARRRGVHRPRGVRFPIPQLRATVDRRLRRWLPCRARRLRAARRQGRAGRGRRRTGWRHAGLGTRRIRQPARAVCRIATRWTAGQSGAVAEGERLSSRTRKI